MTFTVLNSLLLVVSLSLLIAQLLVKNKQAVHVLFAIFCGSISMVAAKQFGNEQWGAVGYLITLGTCATCNVYWLVARALFRGQGAISARHVIAAAGLSALLIMGQIMGFAQQGLGEGAQTLGQARSALFEVVNLLSSCMLMLAAWEGCRGFISLDRRERHQRVVFLSSYISALLLCIVMVKFVESPELRAELDKWMSATCALFIMLSTQALIIWRFSKSPRQALSIQDEQVHEPNNHNGAPDAATQQLAEKIRSAMQHQALYLQANLKVIDLARMMDESEYRISRAIRDHLASVNFNQYINSQRIEHAKQLLADPSNSHWPIVVIGMESGFASVGPFSRAFKQATGCTPHQFRQEQRQDNHQNKQHIEQDFDSQISCIAK